MLSNIFVDLLIRMLTIVVISDLAMWYVIKKHLNNTTAIILFITIIEIIAIVINLWWVCVYTSKIKNKRSLKQKVVKR